MRFGCCNFGLGSAAPEQPCQYGVRDECERCHNHFNHASSLPGANRIRLCRADSIRLDYQNSIPWTRQDLLLILLQPGAEFLAQSVGSYDFDMRSMPQNV